MHTLRIKLKQKLKQLEKERDRVANFIEDIQLQQEIGNLSHQTAKKLIKDRIGDKRVEDFFRDLNYKIRYLQNLIEEEKGNQKLIKKKNKTTIFFWLFLFLVIISMFLFIPVQKLLIGFVTFDNVEIKEYKILKNFSDTTAIELNITDVSSLTASGIFFGNGYAKIFLESNKTRYLVFNSDNLINNNENNYTDKNNYPDNFITGFVIYEQDLFNQTETDNLSGLVFDDISNFDNVSDFNLTSSDNMLLNQVFSENNSIKNNDTINIILIDNNELDNNVTVDNINSIDNNIIDNSVNNYTDNKINNETNNEINNSNDDELNNANIFNGELQNISSAGIVFTDECVETCKLEIPTIKLIIEIQNATIFLEKISYTKKTSIRKINAAPVQIRNISDINTKINETVSINLEDYFSDLDNDTLKFETKEHNNIVIIFYNNVVSYTPKEEGVFSTYIYATDGENLIKSNEFNIIVSGVPTAENKILIQDNNITINNNITIQNPIILTSIHAKNPSFILRNSDFVKEKQIKDSEQKDIINYEIALDNNRSIFNITKWNKEVIFSIKDDIEVKELKEFIDGVSLLNDKYETRIYELENGLEYELIFNQKPETNEITFDIDSKDLVFFYQLPLNEKYNNDSCNATDCGGSHRPENVVGSYAVYHSSKKNDNYKTGKAFHIYRPKIIDANNDSVWGLLNIDTDNNKLTISIPQDFLDKAVYPVVVDPTFGYENIGGSSIVYEPDTVVGSLFTSNNEMGVIDSLYGYLEDKAGSVNVKSIIYLSADRTIISDGISDESFVSGRKWFNFSYSINPNINPNTDYVLSIIGNDFFYIYFDDGNENQGYVDDSNNYDNPDNFVNLVNNKNVYSIYATYTVIANSPPNTPVVLINSSNSTNTSDQDINCFAVISDDNENDLLNVSVNWSRNGVWNMTVDYNNSYPNGYSFNAVLGADKLTNGGNWSCAIQLFDGTNYSAWGYSNNLSVVVASNYYNNCYPNASQNLIINQTTTCTNTNIAVLSLNVSPNTRLTLNNVSLIVGKTNIFGNITIKNSPNTIWQNDNLSIFGTYLLENSTLRINGTTDGSIGITLNGSGTMIINNSANITIGSDNNFNYFFRALNSSKINITNSVIEYAGWSELLGQRGLEVNTSNAFIVNNNFVSNYYGLSVYGSNANISNNFFSGTSAVGIFVNGSNNSTIYNNNISFNTITNIDIFGVRVDSGTNNVFNNNYVYNLKGANGTTSNTNGYLVYAYYFLSNNTFINNRVYNISGGAGINSSIVGGDGGNGSSAYGIYLNASMSIINASFIRIIGGAGGKGNSNFSSTGRGGGGGFGGRSYAFYFVSENSSLINSSAINISGGIGGSGGFANLFDGTGGSGGIGGDSYGVYLSNNAYSTIINNYYSYNITGGTGNYGGFGGTEGIGGNGGSAFSIVSSRNTIIVSSFINFTKRGIYGGGSSSDGISYSLFFSNASNVSVSNTTIINTDDWDAFVTNNTVNVILLNTTFNLTKINVTNISEPNNITIKWYLDLLVRDYLGNNMNNTIVNITDVNGLSVFNGLTDSNGLIERQIITELVKNSTQNTFFNNYTINVSKYGYVPKSLSFNLTSSSLIQINVTMHCGEQGENLVINDNVTCAHLSIILNSLTVNKTGNLTFVNMSVVVNNITVNGPLAIYNSSNNGIWINNNGLFVNSSLIIDNSTLRLNVTNNCTFGITIFENGTVNIKNNANITNGQTQNAKYFFRVNNGSSFVMNNSFLSYAGWSELLGQRGLEVNTSNAFIVNNNFVSNYYGLSVYGSNANISNNFFSGTSAVGIFVNGSNNSTISENNVSIIGNSLNSYYTICFYIDLGENNTIISNNVFNSAGSTGYCSYYSESIIGYYLKQNSTFNNNRVENLSGGNGENYESFPCWGGNAYALYISTNISVNNFTAINISGGRGGTFSSSASFGGSAYGIFIEPNYEGTTITRLSLDKIIGGRGGSPSGGIGRKGGDSFGIYFLSGINISLATINNTNKGIGGTGTTNGNNGTAHAIYLNNSDNAGIINSIITNTDNFDILVTNGTTNAFILNTSIDQTKINVTSYNDPNNISIMWYLNIQTIDYFSQGISNSDVNISDVDNNKVYDLITDNNGFTGQITLTEFIKNSTTNKYLTNYTINATKTGYSKETKKINLTNSRTETITLWNTTCSNLAGHVQINTNVSCAHTTISLTTLNITSSGVLQIKNVTLITGRTILQGKFYTDGETGYQSTIWLNGNLTINNTFILNNSKIRINTTLNGTYNMYIKNNGNVTIDNNANITNGENTNEHYSIIVDQGSKLLIKDSYISNAGWNSNIGNRGLEISTDNATIINNKIINNYYGISIYSSNNTNISDNVVIGESNIGIFFNNIRNTIINSNNISISSIKTNSQLIYIVSGQNNTFTNNYLYNSYAKNGSDGLNGDPPGNGQNGFSIYGFYLSDNSHNNRFINNKIINLSGGKGGNGGNSTENDYNGGIAGSGGSAYGFYSVLNNYNNTINNISIVGIYGGMGGDGGRGASGFGYNPSSNGSDGGRGGVAVAFSLFSQITIYNMSVSTIISGDGGNGGDGGIFGSGEGGDGGNGGDSGQSFGIYCPSLCLFYNLSVVNITSGNGGNPGIVGSGSPGINGSSANSYGISLYNNASLISDASINIIKVGKGYNNGTAYSLFFNNASYSTIINTLITNSNNWDIYVFNNTINAVIINSSFNKSKIFVNSTNDPNNVSIMWYLNIHVNDSSGGVSNAYVNISDNQLNTRFFGLTDNNGWLVRQNITEYVKNSTTEVYFSNYSINVSKSGMDSASRTINMSTNRFVDIFLGSTNNCEPAYADWIINTTLRCENKTISVYFTNITVSGNLTLKNVTLITGRTLVSGNFTVIDSNSGVWQNNNLSVYGVYNISNSTLRINVTSNGLFGVFVNGSGKFYIDKTNISNGEVVSANYFFLLNNGSVFGLRDSFVSRVGYPNNNISYTGLYLVNTPSFFSNNIFSNNYNSIIIGYKNSIINNFTILNSSSSGLFFYNTTNITINNFNITGSGFGVVFFNNSFNNSVVDSFIDSFPYTDILINTSNSNSNNNNTLLNVSFNKTSIVFSGCDASDTSCFLQVKYYFDSTVYGRNGTTPLTNAKTTTISARDVFGSITTGTINSNGQARLNLTSYTQNYTQTYPSVTYYSNYSINVTRSGRDTVSSTLNQTNNSRINFVMANLTNGDCNTIDETDDGINWIINQSTNCQASSGGGEGYAKNIYGYSLITNNAVLNIFCSEALYFNLTLHGPFNIISGSKAKVYWGDSVYCPQGTNLQIKNITTVNGTLELNKAKLQFITTTNGSQGIISNAGSLINISNSTNITKVGTNNYFFRVNGNLSMRDSYMSGAGWTNSDSSRGLYINSNSGILLFNNNTITNNYVGLEFGANARNNTIENSTISSSTHSGIYYSSSVYDINRNDIYKKINITGSAYGFYFFDENTNITIYDSFISSVNNDVYANSTGGIVMNISFINSTITPSKFGGVCQDDDAISIFVNNYLDVYVNDTAGPANNANIRVWDKNNNLILSNYTNSTGWMPRQTITYFSFTSGIYEYISTYYSNHTVNASYLSYVNKTSKVNMSSSRIIYFTMNESIDNCNPPEASDWIIQVPLLCENTTIISSTTTIASTGNLTLKNVTLITGRTTINGQMNIKKSNNNTNDKSIWLNGNLTINGILNLDNSTIKINGTTVNGDGYIGIYSNSSGKININNSTLITNGLDTNYSYFFSVMNGSSFEMKDSFLSNAGWNDVFGGRGLEINTTNATITRNIFSNNFFGISIYSSHINISDNIFRNPSKSVSNKKIVGIYIDGAYNSSIANNNITDIYYPYQTSEAPNTTVYGIYIANSNNNEIISNSINNIFGTNATNGTVPNSVVSGGNSYGIHSNNSYNTYKNNIIENIFGGKGSNATSQNGGSGGDAYAIYINSYINYSTINNNTIKNIIGGSGGDFISGTKNGGSGGNAYGIYSFGAIIIINSSLTNITGGSGGITNSTENYPNGGSAYGIYSYNTSQLSGNTIDKISGGLGGNATNGKCSGNGGNAYGLYFKSMTILNDSQLFNIIGGSGGALPDISNCGANSGGGGSAYGAYFSENTKYSIIKNYYSSNISGVNGSSVDVVSLSETNGGNGTSIYLASNTTIINAYIENIYKGYRGYSDYPSLASDGTATAIYMSAAENSKVTNSTIINSQDWDVLVTQKTYNAELINVNFNRTKINVTSLPEPQYNNITIKWYIDVFVQTAFGIPIEQADVNISNIMEEYLYNGQTNTYGYIPTQTLIGYYKNSTTEINHYPYTFSASKQSYSPNSIQKDIENSGQINITLGGAGCEAYTGDIVIDTEVSCADTTININSLNITETGKFYLINVTLNTGKTKINGELKTLEKKSNLLFNGNLTINSTFTLDNSTLIINTTSNGSIGIIVTQNGNVTIKNNANITNGETQNAKYFFRVNNGSIFSMTDSYLSNAGWNSIIGNRGLEINATLTNFSNNYLTNNYQGIVILSNNNYLENNKIINNTNTGVNVIGNNNILNNTNSSYNTIGINITGNNNTLYNTTAIFNSEDTSILVLSENNTITLGTISYSKFGINILGKNNIISNLLIDSGTYGIIAGNNSYNNKIISSEIKNFSSNEINMQEASLNLTLLNTSFNKTKIVTECTGTGCMLIVQWYLDVRVNETELGNLGNVNVNITDIFNNSIISTTNNTGWITRQNITEFIVMRNSGTETITNYNNYTINASRRGFSTNQTTTNITNSTVIYLTIISYLPTHTNPIIVPYPAYIDTNITCINQSTLGGTEIVTNIFNWKKNNKSITVLNMPFDVNISTTESGAVKDFSGYANNGTLASGTQSPEWIENGKIGGAYKFSGIGTSEKIDDYISFGNSSSLNLRQNFTIMLWFNPTSWPGTTNYLITKYTYSITHESSNGCIAFNTYSDSTHTLYSNNCTIPTNTWVHLAVVYNSTHKTIYINGVNDSAEPYTGILTATNDYLLLGATTTGGYGFNGTIDEVRIYNMSLSARQINQIYSEGLINNTNSTILTDHLNINDNWSCEVTPVDGLRNGTTLASNITRIQQRIPPNNPTVYLNSTTIYNQSNNDINCFATITDDNDDRIYVNLTWYKNGILNSTNYYTNNNNGYINGTFFIVTLGYGNISRGDNWSCAIQLNDGLNYSEWSYSNNLIIRNTPPNQTAPTITPEEPYYYENITCKNGTTTDFDNDNTTTIYTWLNDGVSFTALNMPFASNISDTTKDAIIDYSTNIHHGTLGGGDISASPVWVQGIRDGAYKFDGINDYINISGAPTTNIDNWTIESWIKLSKLGQPDYTIITYIGNDAAGYGFGVNNNNKLTGLFGGIAWIDSGYTFTSTTNWYHIVITRREGTLYFYVNGVQTPTTYSNDPEFLQEYRATIGCQLNEGNMPQRFFNGTIDEVKIYNTSISAEQIYQNYVEGLNNFNTSTIVAEETGSNQNWTCLATPNDAFDDGETHNTSKIISGNTIPNTPSPIIISSDGKNLTNEDINCTATITDNDPNTKLNVSVIWYKNGELNHSIDYNNSYNNNTIFNAILTHTYTEKHQNWSCAIQLNDGLNYSEWGYSDNITILNSMPSIPVLLSPTNGNTTIHDKNVVFIWETSSDNDNDPINYSLIINGTLCPNYEFHNINQTNYTSPELCLATESSYNWTVRACDNEYLCSNWSEQWNFSIEPWLIITLINSSIDFGEMNMGETKDTTTNNPEPFRIRNDGNVIADLVNISSSELLFSYGNDSSVQVKADNFVGEEGSFNWTTSATDWINLNTTNQTIIRELNYSDAKDEAEVDVKIEVPYPEPPGIKKISIYFIWSQT